VTQALVPLLGAAMLFAVSLVVSTNDLILQLVLFSSLLAILAVGLQLTVAYRRTRRFIVAYGAGDKGRGREVAGS
jgi:hypothetical protein